MAALLGLSTAVGAVGLSGIDSTKGVSSAGAVGPGDARRASLTAEETTGDAETWGCVSISEALNRIVVSTYQSDPRESP